MNPGFFTASAKSAADETIGFLSAPVGASPVRTCNESSTLNLPRWVCFARSFVFSPFLRLFLAGHKRASGACSPVPTCPDLIGIAAFSAKTLRFCPLLVTCHSSLVSPLLLRLRTSDALSSHSSLITALFFLGGTESPEGVAEATKQMPSMPPARRRLFHLAVPGRKWGARKGE
jgi:hypothetical protein